jgi:hypothetical protein
MKPRILTLAALFACGLAAEPLPLAGTWRFQLDPADAGEAGGWQARRLAQSIRLPGTTDMAGVGDEPAEAAAGMLTRARRYAGAAWYQRDFIVPDGWKGSSIVLFLERVLWQSKVWVDGRLAGAEDSLNAPHEHPLGILTPGKHTLTIRVDNRMIHPIGDRGHLYTEHTQTIWNGIAGRIELRERPPVSLGKLRVFPDARVRAVKVEAEVNGGKGTLDVVLRELPSRKIVGRRTVEASAPAASLDVPLDAAPRLWDEFSPSLYSAELALNAGGKRDTAVVTFGFRHVERARRRILLNGRRIFLRGNLDNAQFPLTGAPPADVSSWRKLLRVYKDHGLNHVRFHSWCPPEAAFQAADELGVYIQAEVLWIDGWMSGVHPDLGPTAGSPKGVGVGDRTIDGFVRAEIRRLNDAYGNHPSFLMLCIGNELGSSDFDVMGRWLAEEKARDPRRLYSASTARKISAADDYFVTHDLPGAGRTRGRIEDGTGWDYEDVYGKAPLPVIAHEIGQWPVYPVWSEIAKYRGVLKPRNLEALRDLARRNGVAEQDREFQATSGASSLLLYKYEAESFLRTPSCSGVQLLSMQDYAGQGEALVGWLDSFYESKGLATAAEVRRWFGPTVPLVRLPKFVWRSGETLSARAEIAHYGPRDLKGARAVWVLTGAGGRLLAKGEFAPRDVPTGEVSSLGGIEFTFPPAGKPESLALAVRIDGTEFENAWNVFVFPGAAGEPDEGGVLVTGSLEIALDALARGERVLLLAAGLGGEREARQAAWQPLYWSASFFPRQNRGTLGAIVRSSHPALAAFPTGGFLDWQWRGLARGARGFSLDALPHGFRPIVQPVSDFHFSRKLGSIFELRVPEGGRLLVCGYPLGRPGDRTPEARQLLASLLDYMKSPSFQPQQEASAGVLRRIFAAAAVVD